MNAGERYPKGELLLFNLKLDNPIKIPQKIIKLFQQVPDLNFKKADLQDCIEDGNLVIRNNKVKIDIIRSIPEQAAAFIAVSLIPKQFINAFRYQKSYPEIYIGLSLRENKSNECDVTITVGTNKPIKNLERFLSAFGKKINKWFSKTKT